MAFSIQGKDAQYDWIEQTLRRFRYRRWGRGDRSVIRRYLERVSGYSPQTVTRLVAQSVDQRQVRRRQRTVAGFVHHYMAADVRVLAERDELGGAPVWGRRQAVVRAPGPHAWGSPR